MLRETEQRKRIEALLAKLREALKEAEPLGAPVACAYLSQAIDALESLRD